jgi:hypothetical protein
VALEETLDRQLEQLDSKQRHAAIIKRDGHDGVVGFDYRESAHFFAEFETSD